MKRKMDLKLEHPFNNIKPQDVLRFVDSVKMTDRVSALDFLGQLLSDIYELNSDHMTNVLECNSVKVPVIFAILTRCDDISPTVRAKALNVLTQNMRYFLHFFKETKSQGSFQCECSEDVNDMELDMNGNHRFFWYNMKSFRERWDGFHSILHRRVDDDSAATRKTAILAFENLFVFNHTSITKENLECLVFASKDTATAVRKQLIQSITVILKFYRENSLIQAYWLKCILPLLEDAETSVQSKALTVIEVQFLQNIFSSADVKKIYALTLLKLLSSGDFLIYHKFFKKAFSLWEQESKLKLEMASSLINYVGTEYEGCVWFYISYFTYYCPVPSTVSDLGVSRLGDFLTTGDYPSFAEHILKVLEHSIQHLDSEILNTLQLIISDSLKLFSVPIELIPMYINILFKTCKIKGIISEFEVFSSECIQNCKGYISEFNAKVTLIDPHSEELLAKCFCIIKEFCQLCPWNITPSVISPIMTFTASTQSIPSSLTAHAYAALGKMSLQHEILARELLPGFMRELLSSEEDVIRNNTAIILIDLCRRYPSFADNCIPLVSFCFKDKHYLIRYQTIVILTNLLQEGCIKWQSSLFFAFLSTLVDESETIREIGQYNLYQLLQQKKNAFSEHFIGSIFVFNNFVPQDQEVAAGSGKNLERFSIPGEGNRGKRMRIYRFLLESMGAKERVCLIKEVCDVLTSVAGSANPLNNPTVCMVRDCFAILTCAEFRLDNSEQSENAEEATDKGCDVAELKTRMNVMIEPVIQAVVRLKNAIWDQKSDLMGDMILFLKDLLHDFEDSLEDILAEDCILLRQMELEMKSDAERDRTKVKARREAQDKVIRIIVREMEFGYTPRGKIQTKINDSCRKLEQKSSSHKRKRETPECSDRTAKEPRYNLRPLPSRQYVY